MVDYSKYQSPFSYRYGSPQLRDIWGEINRRKKWRYLWFVLAKAQSKFGLITEEELIDISNHYLDVDITKSLRIERKTKHDLVAELEVFSKQSRIGGRILHLGATSADIKDNADILMIRDSIVIIKNQLKDLLKIFAEKILQYKDLICLGYTHLQPAEPTTFGYRLSFYAQDLLSSYNRWLDLEKNLKAKGFKGAVGTSSSFVSLLRDNYFEFEKDLKSFLNINFFEITNQTYPRLQDFLIINELAVISGILSKFAFDIRILHSFGEVTEPFSRNQTGSSAMPSKKNPIISEKICSLAREISVYPKMMWDNYSMSLLERTLDDNANRRNIIPESFLICDEILESSIKLLQDLKYNEENIKIHLKKNLSHNYEKLLNELVKKGANRLEIYNLLNKRDVYNNKIKEFLTIRKITQILNEDDVGIANIQAEKFASLIKEKIL